MNRGLDVVRQSEPKQEQIAYILRCAVSGPVLAKNRTDISISPISVYQSQL